MTSEEEKRSSMNISIEFVPMELFQKNAIVPDESSLDQWERAVPNSTMQEAPWPDADHFSKVIRKQKTNHHSNLENGVLQEGPRVQHPLTPKAYFNPSDFTQEATAFQMNRVHPWVDSPQNTSESQLSPHQVNS